MGKPKTLQEAILFFADEQNCIDTVAALRWHNGEPSCPACANKDHYWLATQKRWKCKKCGRQFSIKRGTIFEDSPLPLDKWLSALWMLVNCKNGISSYEIARDLDVSQKTAWFMLQRLRLALQSRSISKLGGGGTEVEVDETFIGGKARNMHPKERERRITGTGGKDKTIVFGALERGGKVKTAIIENRKKKMIHGQVKAHIEAGSVLYSDALKSYDNLIQYYAHKVIDHAEKYVDGKVHTNGLENFWSLLKRGISGTYVSVEPFHLFRYLDEQVFRYNNRKDLDDADRFSLALSQISGRRLTFAKLTGKEYGGQAS